MPITHTVVLGLLLYGQATFYAPGVFEAVAEYRSGTIPPCQECVGYVALLDEADLGRKVWVSNGDETVGPLLSIDCAAPQHKEGLRRRGWVIDLPPWLAERWRMAGPIQVTISDRPLDAAGCPLRRQGGPQPPC